MTLAWSIFDVSVWLQARTQRHEDVQHQVLTAQADIAEAAGNPGVEIWKQIQGQPSGCTGKTFRPEILFAGHPGADKMTDWTEDRAHPGHWSAQIPPENGPLYLPNGVDGFSMIGPDKAARPALTGIDPATGKRFLQIEFSGYVEVYCPKL